MDDEMLKKIGKVTVTIVALIIFILTFAFMMKVFR
jgi:hypothetical protein